MVKQRIALSAITGVILAAWTSHATAQLCDDRFPMSCGFSAPPSQTRPAPFGPGPIAPRIEAQPEPLVPAAPGRPGAFGRSIDPAVLGQYASLYARLGGEPFPVPAVDLAGIELRSSCAAPSPTRRASPPGRSSSIRRAASSTGAGRRHGDPLRRRRRREGFGWTGEPRSASKQEWPDWSPPAEMSQRQPELRAQLPEPERHRHAGRPEQPARRARPLSLAGQPDTLYRIHGTNEPGPSARASRPAASG